MFALFFIFEFLYLFFLSRAVTGSISRLLMRLTGSPKISVNILFFIFLPGIVIHELSHIFSAAILFVPVGRVEFIPRIEGSEVHMGSVLIGKTDPLRRMIIGVAPVLVGLSILLTTFTLLKDNSFITGNWLYIASFFIVFEISNTMFSSRKDIEGTLSFFIILIALMLALFVMGFRLPDSLFSGSQTTIFLKRVDFLLLVPIGVDLIVFLVARFLTKRY